MSTKINPFLGIYSYTAADASLFHGRDEEIKSLTNVILKNVSTIMTGYSGCGKTSLLQAGILPQLAMCNYHLIRITPKDVYVKQLCDLIAYKSLGAEKVNEKNKEVFYAFEFWCEINRLIQKSVEINNLICINDDNEIEIDKTTLFEKLFHVIYRDKKGNRHFFAVVIDQFEEIFQFGLNIKYIEMVFKIYEVLCGNYIPSYDKVFELTKCKFEYQTAIDGKGEKQIENFEYKGFIFPDRQTYNNHKMPLLNRFVISIRKDYLFDLQSFSNDYPVLYQNVNYIEHLDDEHAAIVIKSGCEDFQDLDTKQITGCIIGKYDFVDDDGVADYRVDTLTLSVVMYEIWEKFDRKEEGYETIANITKNFKEKFDDILNDFYKERIKSLMVGSEKGKRKKVDYLKSLLNKNKFLKNIKRAIKQIVKIFINNIDGIVYNEEEIGSFLDETLFKVDFDDKYVKKSCGINIGNGKYVFNPGTVLGSLLENIKDNAELNENLDVIFERKSSTDINSALVAVKNLAYGSFRNSSYEDVNIKQEIIKTLKKFSLTDSISRCSNMVVMNKLKQHLNQIVFELQEKLLSDSRLYRQSVYIDDICKLFDNAIYGKIDFNRKREWFCQLIHNGIIDESNDLLDICGTDINKISEYLQSENVIVEIIKDNDLKLGKDCVQIFGNINYDNVSFLESGVIDKDMLCSYIRKIWSNDIKVVFEKMKTNCSYNLQLFSNNCKFVFSDIHIQVVIRVLIKLGKLSFELIDSKNDTDEDKDSFRKELNRFVYLINGENISVRDEIADVIKNCKLFTELNKGKKENMLEFRHDRLCLMAKEYLEIHKRRRNNARRYSADVYFSPQGRLKEGNCFVECFLGPWNTYSTVMSSLYFMDGDKSSMVDFDTESISQLKRINYDNASSAIVTIALHERFRGKKNEEYYYDLPTYFTHFRVKIEDNKIYNISFETREKNDSIIKKVVISTGFHKVRFYYDQYDRIVLKEFCVRRDEHKDFYETDIQNSELPQDVRVTLPEVGYNAIYYKYNKIYYKCPSETYFLNIGLSEVKDLRIIARDKVLMDEFYKKLDEDIKLVKDLTCGKCPEKRPTYIVKHTVDGNYGYKSEYDNYGCEKLRRFFGGTIYGFDVIKLRYDDSDNVKSIAFFDKDEKEVTYLYRYRSGYKNDSGIHKIELVPAVSDSGVCKKTTYYDQVNNPCLDDVKKIEGKEYFYEGIRYFNQKDGKNYLLHKLTAKYIGNNNCVQEVIVRKHNVVIASYSSVVPGKRKRINGREININSNIFDYSSQANVGKPINYHKIEFNYSRGIVKTHIFTTRDKEYKYYINRRGDVCERFEYPLKKQLPLIVKGNAVTIFFNSLDENFESELVHKVCVGLYTNVMIDGKVDSFTMVFVEGGEFKMGHHFHKKDYPYREAEPVHKVRVDDFYIGQTTVTVGLWNSVMFDYKILKGKADLPAVQVTWDDVRVFIDRLNDIIKNERMRFRLPTEAEWEYAARGGIYSQNYKYSGSNILENVAVTKTMGRRVSPEKKKDGTDVRLKNELGIYDMSGNVKEWCADYFWSYAKSSVKIADNPVGPSEGYARVVRGGGYKSHGYTCRVYNRDCSFPDVKKDDIGFRLVLEVEN